MASETTVGWSPHWGLDELDDGTPVLTAGADRRLALRGLTTQQVRQLRTWSDDNVPGSFGDDDQRLADRLIQIGVLVPQQTPSDLCIIGDEPFRSKLMAAMEATDASHGLGVLVRTEERWPQPPDHPHLAVDCSTHHTVVIGPYVVPGLTSCVSCLTTRMARRWPDAVTPPQPGVQSHVHVIAQLVNIQVGLIAQGTSPLVNATICWDLEQGASHRQTLLKTPGCALCDRASATGRLALPWSDDGP